MTVMAGRVTTAIGPGAVRAAAFEAGFDDLDDYMEWLRLDGHRRLRLFLREVGDSDGEMLDGLGQVLEPGAASSVCSPDTAVCCHEQSVGLLRFCRRGVRRVQRVLIRHCLAPSHRGEGSVGPWRCRR